MSRNFGYCHECGYVYRGTKTQQIVVRMKREELTALRELAKEGGVSLNQLAIKTLHDALRSRRTK